MSFSLWTHRVLKKHSPISGLIEVEEQLGSYTLQVQGLIQSGGLVKSIWKKAIKNIQMFPAKNWPSSGRKTMVVQNCLILGLGGGSVARLIKARWPQAEIIGVELDPEIIKISRKYFKLDKITGLKIVKGDAFSYIDRVRQKFNLIIVDLYLGRKFAHQAESYEFLKKIKTILNPDGFLIINRVKFKNSHLKIFGEKLKACFFQVSLVKTATNLFFLAEG